MPQVKFVLAGALPYLEGNRSMKLFSFLISFIVFQEQVPFKSSDEFEVNVDLTFKIKNTTYAPSTFSGNGDRLDRPSTAALPFLTVIVKHIKIQNDEVKLSVINSLGKSVLKRKASPSLELRFELGFVDDLKNNGAPNEMTIFFLSKDKKKLRKIEFNVSSDGIFEVNGKWSGQF